jgi:hypothetical protein
MFSIDLKFPQRHQEFSSNAGLISINICPLTRIGTCTIVHLDLNIHVAQKKSVCNFPTYNSCLDRMGYSIHPFPNLVVLASSVGTS